MKTMDRVIGIQNDSMISNQHPSRLKRRPDSPPDPTPSSGEETLKTCQVQIERKTFVFALKQNHLGRFLRITENVNGRRNTIIIPDTGLKEFKRLFENMASAPELDRNEASRPRSTSGHSGTPAGSADLLTGAVADKGR